MAFSTPLLLFKGDHYVIVDIFQHLITFVSALSTIIERQTTVCLCAHLMLSFHRMASVTSGEIRVTIEHIQQAAKRIAPHIHQTPIMTCSSLDKMAGRALHFKCELFQKVGAFKVRVNFSNLICFWLLTRSSWNLPLKWGGQYCLNISNMQSQTKLLTHKLTLPSMHRVYQSGPCGSKDG